MTMRGLVLGRSLAIGLAIGAGLLASGGVDALAAIASSPIGVWETGGGLSHIDVEPCGAHLCGKVVWLKAPLDKKGQPKTDVNNTDPSLRGRRILGMMLMSGFVKAEGAGKWDHGLIYNPRDGQTYRCTLTLDDADHMTVRGYVGLPLFGKSEHWVRVRE